MSGSPPSVPAICLDPRDNVATALVPLQAGLCVPVEPGAVTLEADIPQGHKFCLRPIAEGETVVKYGQPIGWATRDVRPGEHVHVHNCASQRGGSIAGP